MIKHIAVCILLMGILNSVQNMDDPIIIVANTVDRELNTDLVEFLSHKYSVTLVSPSEFENYKNSSRIIMLGGFKALETGKIVTTLLSDDQKTHIQTERSLVITLNVWSTEQVVVILAGPDRTETMNACADYKNAVASFFKGIQSVREMVQGEPVLVFVYPLPVLPSDAVAPYAPSPLVSVVEELPSLVPYTLEEESWFFWIDDVPCAKYAHQTRFVFFGLETETLTVYEEEWWPVLNNNSLWTHSGDYWNKSLWVYNGGLEQPGPNMGRSYPFLTTAFSISAPSTLPGGFQSADRGLIISGWGTGQPLKDDLLEDADSMKDALARIGMRTEKATTVKEVERVLNRWEAEMHPNDTLLLYVTAHGGRGYFLIKDTIFRIYDLITLLEDFDHGVHMIFIFDTCNAGSLIHPLRTLAEAVITSTNEVTPAYGDVDLGEDVNPSDKGSEFTSGLAICIKELSRSREKIEKWKTISDINEQSWHIYLLSEAFTTTQELDVCAVTGYTFPQLWKVPVDINIPEQKEEEQSGCSCGG